MEIYLVELSDNMENQLIKFIDNSPDLPDIYQLIDNNFTKTVTEFKNYSKGINLPKGFVPYSIFYAIDKISSTIVGMVSIRHNLNEYLKFRGGHIGYYVTPSARKKGIGTQILNHSLKICYEINLDRVLITCDKSNIGSNKIILANGGILESTNLDSNGVLFNKYWISLIN